MFKDTAVQMPQIHIRFTVSGLKTGLRLRTPPLNQWPRDVVLDFIAASADGRPERGLDFAGAHAVIILEEMNGFLSDSRQRAAPTGVHGRG